MGNLHQADVRCWLFCSFEDTVIDGTQIINSTHQREVNTALKGLLGKAGVQSDEAAFPAAVEDTCALTVELDSCIAPGGA